MAKIKDPARRVEALVANAEPDFRARFIALVGILRAQLDLDRLAAMLEQGRGVQAIQGMEAAAARLGVAWTDTFNASAQATANFLTRKISVVDISYDVVNQRAVDTMRQNRLRLIREVTAQQRKAWRHAIADGIARGANPREIARDVRDSVGLTAYQVQVVQNYRRALEQGEPSALERKLRDRRFDRRAVDAIDHGGGLSKKQVDEMVERYRQRMVALRAETIARTESLRAVHAGVNETYRQAVDDGIMEEGAITRIWNSAGDHRVRHSHASMDGQERGMDEKFVSGNGAQLSYPGDEFASGKETINCRCVVAHTVEFDVATGMLVAAVEDLQ